MIAVHPIVKRNVQKMAEWNVGEAVGLYRGGRCSAVYFCFDGKTGEILKCADRPWTPEEPGKPGSFRVAHPVETVPDTFLAKCTYWFFPSERGYQIIWSDLPKDLSEMAKLNLTLTVRLYNQLHQLQKRSFFP